MKKIHITESQARKMLSEITLNADEALNTTKNPQTAIRQTIQNAKSSGINTDNAGVQVGLSADALKKNGLAEEDENLEECGFQKFTKKQLEEARVNKMMSESAVVMTKKEILGK
jgi:hypothetical protein